MIASNIFSILFAILSLSANIVNSQVCNNAAQYTACSSNSGCSCLLYSFSDTMGVCGLTTTQDCSLFTACQSPNDACPQGHICVRHSRCSSNPICFPSTSFDQDACPRIIISNYNGEIDTGDGRYLRPGGSSSYYEAIQVVVDRTGDYTFVSSSPTNLDTHGYFYNGTFDPTRPLINKVREDDDSGGNTQFRFTVNLQAGVPYTLVVAPHSGNMIGQYSVNATGPGNAQMTRIDPMDLTTTTTTTTLPPVITSNYANALTVNSANFTRNGRSSGSYYYHAIEVRVPVTGSYTFRSNGNIQDAYGYLYQGNFYPTYPQYNIVAENDDVSGTRNFGFTATLRSDVTYILVVTSLDTLDTGNFDITVTGPSSVSMTPLNI